MRTIFSINNQSFRLLLLAALFPAALFSCKKESDGSPENNAGNPTLTAITPGEAAGNTIVTLTGNGLGQMRSIVFDKNNVPATFQPNLNTETALVFRVPDTAFGGQQNIIFTNSEGRTLSVPFKVIALPTVATISPIDFEQGTAITITGNNLDDVSKVVIEGTATEATIVSKERKKLVVTMPSTTVDRVKLRITNSSGERLSDIELTNMGRALKLFTEGFGPGVQDWSWSNEHAASTNEAYMGTQSLRAVFGAGSYGAISLRYDNNLPFSSYTYLTFWAKGGSADMQLSIWPDMASAPTRTVTIPANVWTYFKIPISYMNTAVSQRLNMQGMNPTTNQTIYFDNILFVK